MGARTPRGESFGRFRPRWSTSCTVTHGQPKCEATCFIPSSQGIGCRKRRLEGVQSNREHPPGSSRPR
eukprot:scaffold689_cov333-Pavlova_lutheri.AAC.16